MPPISFASNSGWLILSENNGWFFSAGFPSDIVAKIGDPINHNFTVQDVVLAPGGGWLILCADKAHVLDGRFPSDVNSTINDLINAGQTLQHVVFGPDNTVQTPASTPFQQGNFLPCSHNSQATSTTHSVAFAFNGHNFTIPRAGDGTFDLFFNTVIPNSVLLLERGVPAGGQIQHQQATTLTLDHGIANTHAFMS